MMAKNFLIFLSAVLAIGCPIHQDTSWSDIKPWDGIQNADQGTKDVNTNSELLLLHNKQRELRGRTRLEIDVYLEKYAQKHAEWMASKHNLQHSDISVLMGKYHNAGENIAWNQENEAEVVDAWMKSPGHRDNIMNRQFSKVGFGVAPAKDGSLFWCTVFGD